MVLDFGLIQDSNNIQTADYRSAGSHQVENLAFETIDTVSNYEEIIVVPADKTYYITGVIFSHVVASVQLKLATGAAASEVDFMHIAIDAETIPITFETPIKMSGGTRITGFNNHASDAWISLIGWQE